jgi:hypothetical protein
MNKKEKLEKIKDQVMILEALQFIFEIDDPKELENHIFTDLDRLIISKALQLNSKLLRINYKL